MIGKYTCPFYHNSGEVCGRTCMRPEGCSYHWKAKRRVPCTDCSKPTGSTSGRCPDHIRGYYVAQHYDKLRSNSREKPYEEIINTIKKMLANIREKTYDEIMVVHGVTLTTLNITLCKECLIPMKIEEGKYCNSCQSSSVV
ncbi:hypothetical protein Glove_632g12 [Diversispora epigaea]|uniref:Uncharacterized protein n=1 Tax=Diversispora epigaea TaxID=1348612 RepID=A0A397G544_9GLOM|nr:hypothetical protein Glove_632g12 [Diversispora epigaea]